LSNKNQICVPPILGEFTTGTRGIGFEADGGGFGVGVGVGGGGGGVPHPLNTVKAINTNKTDFPTQVNE